MQKKIGVKLSIIFLVILLLNVLIVSAETSVTVNGLIKGNDVTVTIIDPTSEDIIAILNGTASTTGDFISSFSATKSTVNLVVVSRSLGNNGIYTISQGPKNFNDYSTNNPITLSMEEPKPVKITPIVNNTPAAVTNTTNTTSSTADTINTTNTTASDPNVTNKTKSSITGFFAKDFSASIFSKIPWKIILYIILGIIILVVILFMVIFGMKKFKDKYPQGIDSRVYFGNKPGSKTGLGVSSSEEKALRAAEEKIRLAQEEINIIRHRKEKIKEAERRLEQDKRELERLKGRF